jgi:F0F1-type ATP synthase assembly protein I
MEAIVFDDWKSFVHCIVGGLSYFLPFISIIFFAYQIAEHVIKHERIERTFGDFIEFFTGFTVIGLFCKLFRLVRW